MRDVLPGPGIDAALIQHEHHVRVRFTILQMTPIPSRPNHLTLACTILQQDRSVGRERALACSFAGGKINHAARQAGRESATDAFYQCRTACEILYDDGAGREASSIQMARSACLAAVPAIVFPPHAPAARGTTTHCVGDSGSCPAGWRGSDGWMDGRQRGRDR